MLQSHPGHRLGQIVAETGPPLWRIQRPVRQHLLPDGAFADARFAGGGGIGDAAGADDGAVLPPARPAALGLVVLRGRT